MNPGDLARTPLSGADVEKQLAEVLGEDTSGLADEADQLTRAHAVLHRALQDNG